MSATYNPHVPNTQSKDYEKVALVKEQVDEVTEIVKEGIDKMYKRGERLTDLQDKTNELRANADQFSRTAQIVHKRMWWKDMKWKIIIAVTILIILGAIVGSVVGTMTKNNA